MRVATTESIYSRRLQLMLVTMCGWRRNAITGRPGKFTLGISSCPSTILSKTQFYTQWLAPQHLHYRLCAVLSREEATAVFLEVMRPREAAPFDQDDIDRCRLHAATSAACAPHMSPDGGPRDREGRRVPRPRPTTLGRDVRRQAPQAAGHQPACPGPPDRRRWADRSG